MKTPKNHVSLTKHPAADNESFQRILQHDARIPFSTRLPNENRLSHQHFRGPVHHARAGCGIHRDDRFAVAGGQAASGGCAGSGTAGAGGHAERARARAGDAEHGRARRRCDHRVVFESGGEGGAGGGEHLREQGGHRAAISGADQPGVSAHVSGHRGRAADEASDAKPGLRRDRERRRLCRHQQSRDPGRRRNRRRAVRRPRGQCARDRRRCGNRSGRAEDRFVESAEHHHRRQESAQRRRRRAGHRQSVRHRTHGDDGHRQRARAAVEQIGVRGFHPDRRRHQRRQFRRRAGECVRRTGRHQFRGAVAGRPERRHQLRDSGGDGEKRDGSDRRARQGDPRLDRRGIRRREFAAEHRRDARRGRHRHLRKQSGRDRRA